MSRLVDAGPFRFGAALLYIQYRVCATISRLGDSVQHELFNTTLSSQTLEMHHPQGVATGVGG